MHPDRVIADLAHPQHAVVGRTQLLRAGLSAKQVDHRLRTGRLEVVHAGVLHIPGAPVTDDARLVAACIAGGDGTFASHRSAAVAWGSPVAPPPGGQVEVMRFGGRPPRRPALIAHECEELWPDDVVSLRGVPVTSMARTLVDLGAVVPWPDALERVLDDALRRRLVTIEEVHRALVRRRGRRGTRVMRELVDARGGGFLPADSPASERLARAIERRGFVVAREHPVTVGRQTFFLDVALPDLMIAPEWDGLEFHGVRSQIVRDAWRRNQLTELGWLVLVFTRGIDVETAAAQVARVARQRAIRTA